MFLVIKIVLNLPATGHVIETTPGTPASMVPLLKVKTATKNEISRLGVGTCGETFALSKSSPAR